MHGTFFSQLKSFLCEKTGEEGWKFILEEAKLPPNKKYFVLENYPDEEFKNIVAAASGMMHLPVEDVLEEFGFEICISWMKTYGLIFPPDKKTLDTLEHAQMYVNHILRFGEYDANAPKIEVTRLNPNELMIYYSSPRRLCALVRGVIKAIAKQNHEMVYIAQTQCMLRGADHCEIHVKVIG